jgi:hypothetical protein
VFVDHDDDGCAIPLLFAVVQSVDCCHGDDAARSFHRSIVRVIVAIKSKCTIIRLIVGSSSFG